MFRRADPKNYYRIAVHEASHALASMYQGVAVHAAYVDRDGRGGATELAGATDDARVNMFVTCAGREGEHLLCGVRSDGGFGHRMDYSRASAEATRYGAGDDVAGLKMLGTCRRMAADFVRDHAPAIDMLARELCARGHMTGDDIEMFLSANGINLA